MTLCRRYCCQDFFPSSTKTFLVLPQPPGLLLRRRFYSDHLFEHVLCEFIVFSLFICDMCEITSYLGGRKFEIHEVHDQRGLSEGIRCEIVIRIQSLFVGQSAELTANGVVHEKSTHAIARHLQQEELLSPWSGVLSFPWNDARGYHVQSLIVSHLTTAVPYSKVGVTIV